MKKTNKNLFKHLLALISFSFLCFGLFFSQGMVEKNLKDVFKSGNIRAYVDNVMSVQADDVATYCLYDDPDSCNVAARAWCKDPGKASIRLPNINWYDNQGCLYRSGDKGCWPGYYTWRCTTNYEGACVMGNSIKSGTFPNSGYVATLVRPGGNLSSGQPYSAMQGPYVYNGTANTGPDTGLAEFYGYYALFVNRYYTNCYPPPTPTPVPHACGWGPGCTSGSGASTSCASPYVCTGTISGNYCSNSAYTTQCYSKPGVIGCCTAPTNTPVPPTSTPTKTPTPTPTPKTIQCSTTSASTSNPTPGSTISFSCTGTGTNLQTLEFHVIQNGSTTTSTQSQSAVSGSPESFSYTVPVGVYTIQAQCRACSGSTCTDWGRNDQIITLP